MYSDGRLGVPPLASLTEHLHQVELEYELESLPEFVEIDLAHVLMLTECGILSSTDGAKLLRALLRIAGPTPEVALPINPAAGSILLQVEAYLTNECGPIGGMLQTARSRIDQDAEAMRLTARKWGIRVVNELITLAEGLQDAAQKHDAVIAPGYTQMQHSQPDTLGHFFNSHYWVISRNIDRICETLARADQSSLGGAALVGTDWPIDRARTSNLLGHLGVVPNARDAGVFSLDVNAEMAGVLALTMSSLGRLAGDIYFWASSEIGLVRLDPGLCGTSSMMPQKRNPYSVQRVRALAGEAVGWPSTQLGVLKLATSTDLDIVCASNRVAEFSHATLGAASLMFDTIRTLEIDTAAMRLSAGSQWSTASGLADQLVRQANLSFRAAHDVVARVVRICEERGLAAKDADSGILAEAVREAEIAVDTSGIDIRASLDIEQFIESRTSFGGSSASRRSELLTLANGDLRRHRKAFDAMTSRIDGAHDQLMGAIEKLIQDASAGAS